MKHLYFRFFAFTLFFCFSLSSQAQDTVYTYAGGGFSDGLPAIVSSVIPSGVAVTANGILYIAGYSNIMKFDPSNGTMKNIAGSDIPGFSGDNGSALNARFFNPQGLALDAAGNLYVADKFNNRIRKITPDGIITTVAGSDGSGFAGDGDKATSALLNLPQAIALDAQNNLYIADEGNHCVRKVNGQTGIITTLAGVDTAGFSGDGSLAFLAKLNSPVGVAVDGQYIYIADKGNYRVRRVNLSSNVITTYAGNGTSGYSGDGGPATSATLNIGSVNIDNAGNVYFINGNALRKVTAGSGTISTVAGSAGAGFSGDGGNAFAALFNTLSAFCFDNANNIFIADLGNYRIRKVLSATGVVNTVAGNGHKRFGGDGGKAQEAILASPTSVSTDLAGNIYFIDFDNARIRKITASSKIISTVAGNGVLGFSGDGGPATQASLSCSGLDVDTAGNIYIADRDNQRIRKVDGKTGIITTIAGETMGFNGDGGPASKASFKNPTDVAVDLGGVIYIADNGNSRIRAIRSDGSITTIAGDGSNSFSGDGGSPLLAGLGDPQAVTVDNKGNVYITTPSFNRVRKISVDNNLINTIAGGDSAGYWGDEGLAYKAGLTDPRSAEVDKSGNVFIADYGNFCVRKINAEDGIISTVSGIGVPGFSGDGGPSRLAKFNSPFDLAFDTAGTMYISDPGNYRIRKQKHTIPHVAPPLTINPKLNPGFQLYPNPASGFIYIKNSLQREGLYVLYNLYGERILSTKAMEYTQIDLSALPTSMYLLRLENETTTLTVGRIVKVQ